MRMRDDVEGARKEFNDLVSRRGYVVASVPMTNQLRRGDQIVNLCIGDVPLGQPVYVIRETDRQDYLEQDPAVYPELPGPVRYWRVGTD